MTLNIFYLYYTFVRRNTKYLRYTDETTLMAESEEELKSLLMKGKGKSEKVGLKFNTKKSKIMGSGPITLWQIDGETMETVTDFGAPKSLQMVTAAVKLKDALGRKGMTNLDSILKSRDITNKGPSSQGYGFSSSHVWI